MKDFIERNKTTISSTVTSCVSVFLAIAANLLYKWLLSSIDAKKSLPTKVFLFICIIALAILSFWALSVIAEKIKAKIWPEFQDDRVMKHAFLKIRQLGSNRQRVFQENHNESLPMSNEAAMIRETVQNMQLVVESCYDFFESVFSKTGQLIEPISFETTFMTESYNDNKLTIPCSANKEKRTPISMLFRAEKKDIYDSTVTASIYSMDRPKLIIIEDTAKDDNYIETYTEQKKRIKSSAVMPILSHNNVLLGTLVVHCNQPSFFKKNRYDFWNELLELFSVELGYYKLYLDYLLCAYPDSSKPF